MTKASKDKLFTIQEDRDNKKIKPEDFKAKVIKLLTESATPKDFDNICATILEN